MRWFGILEAIPKLLKKIIKSQSAEFDEMRITMSRSITLASKVTLDQEALKSIAIYKVFISELVCKPTSQEYTAKRVGKEGIDWTVLTLS